ncbi:AraC family transcriptional regulator [Psychromonas sp. B3M02]|uniref:AraC family transcriptional regulator n=1 Tax=unclassified Psychromonas TaxID=2614957 RepID=UPI000DEA3A1B|nr:AraC family transcriptional regulator [Psychromonas sp. B3M02]RBW46532.1 AraC family transcriptional regulator [Psychromonas sp. B3M02]
MQDNLSIRAYSKQQKGHVHCYHQLVLPIIGTIIIELEGYTGKVSVGECVVIPAQVFHLFKADESARFIVADLNQLPDNLLSMSSSVFAMSAPLRSYLLFIEQQLQHKVDQSLEKMMIEMFSKLLSEQIAGEQIDPRVRAVLQTISDDLSQPLHVNQLAQLACLSPTQFKKVFKQCIGQSVLQYITEQRMEKAKALLTHTDIPVQLISEQVGYSDISAFSRRFSQFYQLSPRQIRR